MFQSKLEKNDMLKINIYFRGKDKTKAVYLPGISKRLSALGLQPITRDRFRFVDLARKDQELIMEASGSSADIVEVRERDFSFGIKFSELNVHLEVAQTDKNLSDREMFNELEQLA